MQQLIWTWLVVTFVVAWLAPASASAFAHPGGTVTAAQIERANLALAADEEPWSSAWARVLERAQQGLDEEPSAVADLHIPGFYEDPVGHELAKRQLRDDVNAAFHCALVHQIGFELEAPTRELYGAKARELLNAWASQNQSVSGTDGRLVMAYVGAALVSTAELLADDPAWGESERASFSQWVDLVLRDAALIESEENNWGSWGVFAGIAAAYWRNDAEALDQHALRLRELIDLQIDPSGNLPDEINRGERGLWYTYFSLAPLSHGAEIVRNATGEDLFIWEPPSGGSLGQALDTFLAAAHAAQDAGGDPETTPAPDRWGGDLLYATGSAYGDPVWGNWADPPFGSSNSAWKTPDLLSLPEPSRGLGLLAAVAALFVLARRRRP